MTISMDIRCFSGNVDSHAVQYPNTCTWYVYDTECECNLELCRERLLEKFERKWKADIQTKPKLRTYVKLKDNYCTQNYVKLNLTRPQRSKLAQIRLGILPLYIETGRYTNVKIENRICQMCNENKIESELHFIMSCPLYKEERQIFFNSINVNFNSYSLADNLKLLCTDYSRKLSKFVSNIWEKRKCKLYNQN